MTGGTQVRSQNMAGISKKMPVFATIAAIIFLFSFLLPTGLPLLNGYAGKFNLPQVFAANWKLAAWAAAGALLASACLLVFIPAFFWVQ